MKKILLVGKNGQIGWELQRSLPALGTLIAPEHHELELTNSGNVRRVLRDLRPDIIINAAAYTAVDKAESDTALASAVNAVAPAILAEEAKQLGSVLVHYSTDYVFDSSKSSAYTEDDVPNPQNVYGKTKLAGEQAIRASGCRHLILRTSWVYGVHGGNFVKTVLRLAKERGELRIVADQSGAPTWARDLANATVHALIAWEMSDWSEELGGTYHLTAGGRTSWHQYAEEIVRLARQYDAALADKALVIKPIATQEYPVAAKRPANSVLANDKVRDTFGIVMPQWQKSLSACMHLLYEQVEPR
ncbi:MAG TPA: dTDP-4-dehydrorhamnose reductase [Gallionellaceae bacterium]|nr:dTDP-4-dehydrorhamnose reductase [Gallionellaceae bacterium]